MNYEDGAALPRSALTSLGSFWLLVMASCRMAFAIISAGALLWVYGLTVLVYFVARPALPRKGKRVILLFLSGFFGGLYLLLFQFLNPLISLGNFLFVLLIPPCCIGSGVFRRCHSLPLERLLPKVFLEAALLGFFIIVLAMIREPLGFGCISLPGGVYGMIEHFNAQGGSPVLAVSASSGGLLILGYILAFYRRYKNHLLRLGEPS